MKFKNIGFAVGLTILTSAMTMNVSQAGKKHKASHTQPQTETGQSEGVCPNPGVVSNSSAPKEVQSNLTHTGEDKGTTQGGTSSSAQVK